MTALAQRAEFGLGYRQRSVLSRTRDVRCWHISDVVLERSPVGTKLISGHLSVCHSSNLARFSTFVLDKEPAIVVGEPDPALHLTPQNAQLMPGCRVLCFKPALRLKVALAAVRSAWLLDPIVIDRGKSFSA